MLFYTIFSIIFKRNIMAKKKFYVILEGNEPGIYDNWSDCENRVKGYKGAKYKGFATKEEAELAWDLKSFQGTSTKNSKKTIKPSDFNDIDIDFNTLSVDGACSGNPGVGEYQCVDTKTKEVIFSSNSFIDTTNNIMEFFALVEALIYINDNKIDKKIYSDSITAIAWVRNMKVKTTLNKTAKNEDSHFLISKYEKLLRERKFDTSCILKWDTQKLGEIPADFGRK